MSINLLYSYAALEAAINDVFLFEQRSTTYLGVKIAKYATSSSNTVGSRPHAALRNRTQQPRLGNRQPRMLDPDKYKLIASCHNRDVGHWGVALTCEKVRLKQRWDRKCTITVENYSEATLRSDVSKFISNCPCCQKMSQLKPYIYTYRYVALKYGVLEHLAMDAIVGLPKSFISNSRHIQ